MITKEKMPGSFIKFSQLILKGNVCRSLWRICTSILGLKGLRILELKGGKGVDCINPLSPKGDQHQISPCNINDLSIRVVMRITDMITQDEFA